jgi:outer membrane protein assembly factor BamD (BamD/ComL family)
MHLVLGRRLFGERDFAGALQEHEKVSSLVQSGPINEEALLYTGLIYADPANPRKDYARSLGYFKRLSESYPKSPYAQQAKIMIAIMRENEESIRTIERLKALIEAAKRVDIGIEDRKREKVR